MQYGEQVNGLMMNRHWRFVVADMHMVCQAIQQHDSRARLCGNVQDGEIAVARWIEREALGDEDIDAAAESPITSRGGAWMLVMRPRRNGKNWIGEPDMSVLTQLQASDAHRRRRGVKESDLLEQFRMLDRIREESARKRMEEITRDRTERALHGIATARKDGTWRPGRIIVPRGV